MPQSEKNRRFKFHGLVQEQQTHGRSGNRSRVDWWVTEWVKQLMCRSVPDYVKRLAKLNVLYLDQFGGINYRSPRNYVLKPDVNISQVERDILACDNYLKTVKYYRFEEQFSIM